MQEGGKIIKCDATFLGNNLKNDAWFEKAPEHFSRFLALFFVNPSTFIVPYKGKTQNNLGFNLPGHLKNRDDI